MFATYFLDCGNFCVWILSIIIVFTSILLIYVVFIPYVGIIKKKNINDHMTEGLNNSIIITELWVGVSVLLYLLTLSGGIYY